MLSGNILHADEGGPFIYNPSEARDRLRLQLHASKAAAQWICGESAAVIVDVWNPTCQVLTVRAPLSDDQPLRPDQLSRKQNSFH